jgi:hypothetical protein
MTLPHIPETPGHIHDFGEGSLIVPTVKDALFAAIPSESRFCAPCGIYEIRVLGHIPESEKRQKEPDSKE